MPSLFRSVLAACALVGVAAAQDAMPSDLHGFELRRLNGAAEKLSAYRGKVCLVVNVASDCGLTKQYAALQKLHDAYQGRGFAVLGFPSNDFGGQEPGTEQEIAAFCTEKYSVTFPMFEKVATKGDAQAPLYRWLTKGSGFDGDVQWNFQKYLVGPTGKVLAKFDPRTKPDDPAITAAIEKALGAPAAPQDGGAKTASAWKVLFDGKSTAGWRSFRGKAFPEKGWAIEDGALRKVAGAGGGDIVTEDEYADFDFRFEWKVAPGANSGVMYRVSEEGEWPWRFGPEYQILDDAKHQDGKDPKTSAAGCYALYPGEGKVLKPVGEWNEGRVVILDGKVEHWLNGVRVVAYDLNSEEWKAKVAGSKFKDMAGFGSKPKGRLALQDHGDDVWYRNLRVRTYSSAPAKKLFDGKMTRNWTHHLENGGKAGGTWTVDGDVLVCKGEPAGYVRTTEDFGNFVLKLSWRFDPVTKAEGNSGVLFRMTGSDKVWPKSLEAQLHSKNAGDFWLIDGFKLTTDPARTRGNYVKKLSMAENPPGEWNRYEIEVDGGDVELRVNGRVVNFGTGADLAPGKICLQSEGVAIHFKDVEIVPIGG
jgi:glutathione peroxidase-family protein